MLNEKNLRGLRHRVRDLVAAHTIGVEEGGTTFMLGTGSYTITLPLIADAGPGWHCSFISTGATQGGEVNIQDSASESADSIALIHLDEQDGVNDLAAADISFETAATRGSLIEIFTDGNYWYAFAKGGSADSFDKA